MAKVLVEDREENARVPFLRGILIRSLQDSGLSFDAAYELATEIRNGLSDTSEVTTSDLRQRVIEQLKTRSEDTVIDRYRKQKSPFGIQIEQRDGQLLPFSRIEYQHCLENIGLSSDDALEIVATVHQHLVDRRFEMMTSWRVGELCYGYL